LRVAIGIGKKYKLKSWNDSNRMEKLHYGESKPEINIEEKQKLHTCFFLYLNIVIDNAR